MQERNVLAGATATVISPLVDFYGKLMPFLWRLFKKITGHRIEEVIEEKEDNV